MEFRRTQTLQNNTEENEYSMERLHTWAPKQNFSAILNNPNNNVNKNLIQNIQYSYIEDIKNRLYNTLYDEKSNLDFEISKDFDKILSADISSPRSISSTKSTKISLK